MATVGPSDSGCLQLCLLFFGCSAEGSEHFAMCVVKVFLIDLTEMTASTLSCSPCFFLSPSGSFGHILFPLWFEFQISVLEICHGKNGNF